MSKLTAFIRKARTWKWRKPLQEVAQGVAEGKEFDESVIDYAKEVVLRNGEGDTIGRALDDLIYHVGQLQRKVPEVVVKVDALIAIVQNAPLEQRVKERLVYRLCDVRKELTGNRLSIALTVLVNIKSDWERGKE